MFGIHEDFHTIKRSKRAQLTEMKTNFKTNFHTFPNECKATPPSCTNVLTSFMLKEVNQLLKVNW